MRSMLMPYISGYAVIVTNETANNDQPEKKP